ncbi:hypothetical protein GC173_16560 [bacterium]|nr:hypothetical protein [bacterium]
MERYMTYQDAATELGWSRTGLRHWVRRHNRRHPENQIRRLCGKICLSDFLAAIQATNERYAPHHPTKPNKESNQ